jgi:hypothetical protein
MRPKHTIVDGSGRVWGVYDFQIIAGKSSKTDFGRGQYRGFAPVDGGARRFILMYDRDRALGTSEAVLQAQLAQSKRWREDDPELMARYGRTVERADPPTA